jgi:hypothetical protein
MVGRPFRRVGATHRMSAADIGGLHPPYNRQTGFWNSLCVVSPLGSVDLRCGDAVDCRAAGHAWGRSEIRQALRNPHGFVGGLDPDFSIAALLGMTPAEFVLARRKRGVPVYADRVAASGPLLGVHQELADAFGREGRDEAAIGGMCNPITWHDRISVPAAFLILETHPPTSRDRRGVFGVRRVYFGQHSTGLSA